jgi:hypothetical protein
VFDALVKSSQDLRDKEFQIIINFLEVHQEVVRDLLSGFVNSKNEMNNGSPFGHDSGFSDPSISKIGRKELEGLEVHENSNG